MSFERAVKSMESAKLHGVVKEASSSIPARGTPGLPPLSGGTPGLLT
jgi:hypothetical protein